jgi:hypothetical protein
VAFVIKGETVLLKPAAELVVESVSPLGEIVDSRAVWNTEVMAPRVEGAFVVASSPLVDVARVEAVARLV